MTLIEILNVVIMFLVSRTNRVHQTIASLKRLHNIRIYQNHMTISVSSHNWQEFWQEEKPQCLNKQERIWSFYNHLGTGYRRQIFLRSGISIYIHELKFIDNIC